jgi:hypothetical protein
MSTVDEDNLDGVTREELVRAQIAKHKEILEPDSPVVTRLAALEPNLAAVHHSLVDIHGVLAEILDEIRKGKNKSNVDQLLIAELITALEAALPEMEKTSADEAGALLEWAKRVRDSDQNENKT